LRTLAARAPAFSDQVQLLSDWNSDTFHGGQSNGRCDGLGVEEREHGLDCLAAGGPTKGSDLRNALAVEQDFVTDGGDRCLIHRAHGALADKLERGLGGDVAGEQNVAAVIGDHDAAVAGLGTEVFLRIGRASRKQRFFLQTLR
jgi:hypothetical protein